MVLGEPASDFFENDDFTVFGALDEDDDDGGIPPELLKTIMLTEQIALKSQDGFNTK